MTIETHEKKKRIPFCRDEWDPYLSVSMYNAMTVPWSSLICKDSYLKVIGISLQNIVSFIGLFCKREKKDFSVPWSILICMGLFYLDLYQNRSRLSFAKEPYKRDYILQKRPIFLRSLLLIATPYPQKSLTNTECCPFASHSHMGPSAALAVIMCRLMTW